MTGKKRDARTYHEPTLFGEKRCSKCDVLKQFYCFPADHEMTNGIASQCHHCHNERTSTARKKGSRPFHLFSGVLFL